VEAGKISSEKVRSICKKYSFTDCRLLEALVKVESDYNARSYNPEKTGSIGLMQIQCATAKWMGFKDCKKLFKPSSNIYVGIKYLKFLKNLHKIEDIKTWVASWNAGKPIICKYYNKNKCKPGQFYNQRYVNKVMEAYAVLSNNDREVKDGSSKMGTKN
jgi:soluble lytic murein transglycosylase-like protein